MALAFSHLTAGRGTSEPVTTASISPTSGGIVFLTFALTRATLDGANPTDALTVTGLSGTWTKLSTGVYGTLGRAWLYQGTGLSGSGAITIDYTGPGTVIAVGWVVDQATGQDASTPVSDVATTGNSSSSITPETTGSPDAGDATYSIAVLRQSDEWTAESGWTTLGATNDNPRVESAYDASTPIDTSCTWTHGNALGDNRAFIGIINVAVGSDAKSASDTSTVSLTEATTLGVASTVTDTLTLSLTEAETLAASSTVTDSPTVSLTEATTLAAASTVTDAPTVSLTEAETLAASSTVTDTPTFSLAETATVTVAVSASDTLAVSTPETSEVVVVASISGSDTATVSLTETSSVVVGTATAARVRIADTATGSLFREWEASAASQDSPAGTSVVITITQATGGATPPGEANTLTLNIYNDSGALIRSFTLTPSSASQNVTFHFTNDGTSTGAARAGTVEVAIRATRTDAGAYDVESDGTPNTPGTGNTSARQRGWARGTTTSVTTISNVSLGGAKASPAEYDESLFVRTTLGAPLYVARALTTAVSGATPALSAVTNSSAAGPWDATFTTVVDERFPAGVTTVVTSLTVPNASVSSAPATVLTATNDSMTVDPRLIALLLWQTDDDTFGTPPTSKHEASKSALVSSYSGAAFRLTRSRTATGVNGLSTTITLNPRSAGSDIVRTSSTATRGGEAGWTDLAQLGPFVIGGQWDITLVVTAPSDIDATGYVVNSTDAVTILAQDPRIQLRGYLNLTANQAGHFNAGVPIVLNMTVRNHSTNVRIDPSRVTETKVGLLRYRSSDHRLEYLDTDLTTWVLWEPTAAMAVLPLAPSPNDPRNYILEITNTVGWTRDIVSTEFFCKVDGTPYFGTASREETGPANDHIGYDFDAIAFATGRGVVSFS